MLSVNEANEADNFSYFARSIISLIVVEIKKFFMPKKQHSFNIVLPL